MKKFLILVVIFLSAVVSNAQGYRHAIGLRAGYSAGFEYRYYIYDESSYKFLLSTRNHGLQIHAMKEFHRYDLFDFSEQLVFFFGYGIHVGYQSWDVAHHHCDDCNTRWYSTNTAFIAGADGLAGLEYIFYEVPVSLGIEVKPYLDLFGRKSLKLQPFDFAFTIKYLF